MTKIGTLISNRAQRRLIIALGAVLPMLPFMLERWIFHDGSGDPTGASLFAMLASAALVGTLLLLVVRRLGLPHPLQRDLTDALDSAAIALVRPTGELIYWSGGCEALYGWSADEVLGIGKHVLLKSRAVDGSDDIARLEQERETELIETRRDGTSIHTMEQRRILEREHGSTVVVLKMLDITVRANMELELRQSEERFALAAEVNDIGVFEWDVSTGAISWSPGSEQRLGVPPGSLSSFESWRENIPAEDLASIMAKIENAVAERRRGFSFQYHFMVPGESPRLIEGTSHCTYKENGELIRTVGSAVDVTDRNTRDAELRLKSIIETVPDATIVIDDKGTVRSFSTAAEAMFGWTAAEVIGQNIKMLMPPKTAEEHDRFIMDYLTTGERKVIGRTRELTARREDGSWFPIELNVGEARIGDERIFTGIVRDVSDRLAGEKRLSDLNAELAHVSRQSAMSEFAADLAHELNQPLSATANYLAATRILLERGEHEAQLKNLVQLAEEQTQRSGEIIRRLRDFLAKREVDKRRVSLEQVARSAVELVVFGAALPDIELSYSFAAEADDIFADRVQVQQVFVNLLRNAFEALRTMPEDHLRKITISSKLNGEGMAEIALSDTGPGIPQSVREPLYERFATSKSGSAMGIGLSISRRIVEAHGGKLNAENRESGGATFRFTLPLMEELDDGA